MTVEPKPLRLTTPDDDTSATEVLLLEYVRVPSAEALRLNEPSFNSLTKLSAAALIVCSALFTVTVTSLVAGLYLSVSAALTVITVLPAPLIVTVPLADISTTLLLPLT